MNSNPLGNFARFAKDKKIGEGVSDKPESFSDSDNTASSDSGKALDEDFLVSNAVADSAQSVDSVESTDSVTDEIVKRVHESQVDQESVILMVDQCSPDSNQPRKSFDAVQERADSIEAHGLLQAIVVRPDPEHPNRYIIVSGETRWRAFKEILMLKDPVKYSTIPARIKHFSDDAEENGDVLMIQLIENLQRTDLSPLEEAEGLQRLKDAKQINNKQLSALIKKSESRVSRILKLLTLTDEEKSQVESGEISAREIQRGKGTEAAKQPTVKKEDTQKPRESKLSISMETAQVLAELLKVLSEQNGLADIDLGKKNKKDLIAVLESRAADILGAIK